MASIQEAREVTGGGVGMTVSPRRQLRQLFLSGPVASRAEATAYILMYVFIFMYHFKKTIM